MSNNILDSVGQNYEAYTQEDHNIWKILFSKQAENLTDKSSSVYLECLKTLSFVFKADGISRFSYAAFMQKVNKTEIKHNNNEEFMKQLQTFYCWLK